VTISLSVPKLDIPLLSGTINLVHKHHAAPSRLKLGATPLGIVGTLILFVLLSSVAIQAFHLPLREAVLLSLAAFLLHWVSILVHQLGHAWAALATGYPMTGIRLGAYGFFATSLYPSDEPVLPSFTHARRALGGPVATGALALVALAMTSVLGSIGTAFWWLGSFLFFDNLALAVISLMPLGFTDGGVLLRHWMQRGRRDHSSRE
jgi:Zn-dependent protease